MFRATAYSVLAVGMSLVMTGNVLAMAIAPEKMKSYAEIYPELFQGATVQNVTYHPTGSKSQAVSLLVNSFDDETDVDELSAVLRPQDMAAATSSIKPDAQIKKLLTAKGLEWHDYTEITHTLATDPELFQHFITQLDRAKIEKSVISRAAEDPTFIGQISSLDQQAIVRNLLKTYKTK